jgi:hypothetical protein
MRPSANTSREIEMAKYIVEVENIRVYEIEIEAEDEADAQDKVRDLDWIAEDFEPFEVNALWTFSAGMEVE